MMTVWAGRMMSPEPSSCDRLLDHILWEGRASFVRRIRK